MSWPLETIWNKYVAFSHEDDGIFSSSQKAAFALTALCTVSLVFQVKTRISFESRGKNRLVSQAGRPDICPHSLLTGSLALVDDYDWDVASFTGYSLDTLLYLLLTATWHTQRMLVLLEYTLSSCIWLPQSEDASRVMTVWALANATLCTAQYLSQQKGSCFLAL